MFQCEQCASTFTRKDNLVVHQKKHAGVRFPCTACPSTFSYKNNLNKHLKNIHGIVPAHLRPLPAAPIIDQPARPSVIQFAPRIVAPGSAADDTCVIIEDEDTDSYTTSVGGKRISIANTVSAVKAKKARMELVRSPGLREISSSGKRKIVWYFAKNLNNVRNYSDFLRSLQPALTDKLKTHVQEHPIKFSLKLEATYNRPNVSNSSENRAFTTSAKEIFMGTKIETIVEESFMKLLAEEDTYISRGSGFTLESIDDLLLAVYKYTPISGSSYIQLPKSIIDKRAIINPKNTDQQCFKWAILAKYVAGENKFRVNENYTEHEDKYIFNGISFPTPLSDISKFEKNNQNVSVNVYGLEKRLQPPKKYPSYEVFPLKVVDDEKRDHFDLLLVTDGNNTHYTYISNFSRLLRSQKTSHAGQVIFCKRCFTSFDRQNLKYKLSGQAALEHHRLICGPHKPIRLIMPKEGDVLQFTAWQNAQRHPIVIYADFEALLVKTEEEKGDNTTIIQKHRPMSYGFLVKASENVPIELLTQFNIPIGPVIYRGSESRQDVAKHFIYNITDVAEKIEQLLKTNVMINMSAHDKAVHEAATHCNLCCIKFTPPHEIQHRKTADHCHLSGKYRQALCNMCNQKLQTPVFVPCFLHNLSNYDAHFIVTELGYNSKRIKVIPNS
ncbi:uncharacterized protein LOC132942013 [Metopolophium dirhodum]|uniref:uncharacterized protein LOC132942013 n=1 Tax=Metopolophium dirhodum TaxID=44670 RepID=UPI00298F6515|nr:uncharacterized protein LOC132942013 [Metopolophium dirhodum]